MIVEMHSHTAEHSACSHVKALDLVRRAFEKGLQGIVLTDHHYCWPEENLADLRRRAQVPNFFLLVSGQEVTTSDFGDVLVYGADRTIPPRTPVAMIRRDFPDAALVWAHPYRDERTPEPQRLLDPRLDAVEIFNANHTHGENTRGLRDWHRHRFTAIAGTDTHAASYTGTFPTIFDHPVATIEELAAEVRRGRCRPFFSEIPRAGGNIQITELTLGSDSAREKLIIKELEPQKWGTADRAFHILEELRSRGFESGPFRVPRPLSRDARSHTLIEEGILGRHLFDKLVMADAETARHSLRLTAQWLARLHGSRLRITPPEEFLENEEKLLRKYLAAFVQVSHRYTRRAREITDTLLQTETIRFRDRPDRLVQGHGDFNPKNVLVGQDNSDDPGTTFIAVIDFDYSTSMPPALDVGTFLAHFRHQFHPHPEVLDKVSEEVFLDAYLAAAPVPDEDFRSEVELFRARANMSIAYFLIKVGMGETEDLWRVLVESDHVLARLAIHGFEVSGSRFRPSPNLPKN